MIRKLILALALLVCLPLTANASTCFWVGGTANWDNVNTTSWASGTGGTPGTCAATGGICKNGAADICIFDGLSGGGTVTVCGALSTTCPSGTGSVSIGTLTSTAFTGTLDFSAIDPNITIASTWTDIGSGAHTVNMGDGTWTFTIIAGTPINVSGASLTLNANSSTILFSAVATSSRTFTGGKTFNNFTVTNASASRFGISIGGSSTFNNVTFTNCQFVAPLAATTQTISGTLTYDGQSAAAPGILNTNTGATATINVANATTLNNIVVQGITKAGAGSITANNSYDGGGNSGVTINAPAGTGGGFIIGGG